MMKRTAYFFRKQAETKVIRIMFHIQLAVTLHFAVKDGSAVKDQSRK